MRSEKDKMLAGEPYDPGDAELQAGQRAARAWMQRYNAALAQSPQVRHGLLAELLGEVGNGAVVRPPFHCDYGTNIRLGEGVFLTQLRDPGRGASEHRRRHPDRPGGADLCRRPSA